MVTLQNNQEFFSPCEYLVCEGGDYDEQELVNVYRRDDVEKTPWVSYQAGFIALGNDFYTPKEGDE